MGKTFELGNSAGIGTGSSNDVRIKDRRIADNQARITSDNGAYTLTNLDLSREVRINDKVTQTTQLQHGDMIKIAGTIMLFSDDTMTPAPKVSSKPVQDIEGQSTILSRKRRFPDSQAMLNDIGEMQAQEIQSESHQRLMTLCKIAAAINDTFDMDQLLERLMTAIFEEFSANQGFIMLREEGRPQLTHKISWRKPGGRVEGKQSYSRTIIEEVVKKREAILSTNLQSDERFRLGLSSIDEEVQSTICVPLLRGRRILGVLQLDSFSLTQPFNEEDLGLLSKIAVQSAVAIETMATYEEPKQFSKNLRSLGRATQWLSSYLQSAEIIKETVTFACSIFQCQKASVMLLDEKTSKLRMAYAIGLPKEFWQQIELDVGQGYTGQVVAEGSPLLVPDPETQEIPDGVETKRRPRYRTDSFLIVPILARTSEIDPGQKIIGAINVTDKLDGRFFSRNDQELLTILAHQSGIALTNANLYEKATVDNLTRLFVRRYFFQKLSETIRKSRRLEKPLSLLMFDLDHFKKFNDSFGHQAGDAILRLTGERVKCVVRGKDVPARYGGEEFAVILPDTPIEIGEKVAERIRQAIGESAFLHEDIKHDVTVSVGISELTSEDSRESLIKKADTALYQAKDGGRNRVCLYRDSAVENN